MKKYKNWLMLPMIALFFVSIFVFSACNKRGNGGHDKYYSINITGQLPQGVSGTTFLNGNSIKEGENAEFTIGLLNNYLIGDLKVFGNNDELLSYKSESTVTGMVYYYRITNVRENVEITFSGAVESRSYSILGRWVDFNNTSPKDDDKDIENFFVDMVVLSASGNSTATINYHFDSMLNFKEYLSSDVFYSSGFLGDTIQFTIYSIDDCESYVDDWIIYNDKAVTPYATMVSENNDGVEKSYLKAQYNVYIEEDTTIYFYEKEIVRSAEIKETVCIINDIDMDDATLPRLVLKDETGTKIDTYAKLKTAGTINAHIENVSDVWRPIFKNSNLIYNLSLTDFKFEFKEGEYASDKGSFVFKNVDIPYNRGTFVNYTLEIENIKEIILNSSNYKKMSITKNNIKSYNLFDNDYINIEGEGEYCYVQCKNNMYVDVYNNYTKIQITLSNDIGETKTLTLNLPTSSKAQTLTDGYTISRYRMENNYNKYLISYDGTSTFYNNIEFTAL